MEEFLDWTNRASLSDGKNSTEDTQGESSSSGDGDGGAGVSPDAFEQDFEENVEQPPDLDALIDEDLTNQGYDEEVAHDGWITNRDYSIKITLWGKRKKQKKRHLASLLFV